jgi:hypothetical protein
MVITVECWFQNPMVIHHGILTLEKVGTAVHYPSNNVIKRFTTVTY